MANRLEGNIASGDRRQVQSEGSLLPELPPIASLTPEQSNPTVCKIGDGVAAGVQHVPEFHMQPLLAVREYV